MEQQIKGFSKLSKLEKIDFIANKFLNDKGAHKVRSFFQSYWHSDNNEQKIFDEFSENTITNFYFPYGIAPNILINNKSYCVPMVIEESSVVAACSKAAKFWYGRGGFKASIIGTKKSGQVHFKWQGQNTSKLEKTFNDLRPELMKHISGLTSNMEKRGGGVRSIELIDRTSDEDHYYQLRVGFETCDAMGANFINSVLEALADKFSSLISAEESLLKNEREVFIIMSILTNYTPECRVKVSLECPVADLDDPSHGMPPEVFAEKIKMAVKISKIDIERATTHNKGIFNGIDAVVLATGNDFRATSACGHTYAARDGQYRGLTDCEIENDIFKLTLEIPLALGTVGGLTALHPMASTSLDILGRPSSSELMEIVASIGLAQNFGALRSLVTNGIQKGHMKMHLMNILNHLEATKEERELAKKKFQEEVVSFSNVREFLSSIRNYQ